MKHTHKLRALGDAPRVVAASPSVAEAARRLKVNPSSVHRWIASGAVPRPAGRQARALTTDTALPERQSPEAWSQAVREAYDLSPTEAVLVQLAERALRLASSTDAPPAAQLAAMGRFQALTKQLHLEEVTADGEIEAPAATGTWPRRVR